MCTVAVLIQGVGIVRHEVPAMHIIDEAVAIVVQSIARNLSGVVPDVVGEVRMGVVDARVHQRQQDVVAPGADVPALLRADVRAGSPLGLPSVVQAPLPVEFRVVREHRHLDQVVGLDVENVGMASVALQGFLDAHPAAEPEVLDAAQELPSRAGTQVPAYRLALRWGCLIAELDQDFAGAVRGQRAISGVRRQARRERRRSQQGAGDHNQCRPRQPLSPAMGAGHHKPPPQQPSGRPAGSP